MTTPDSEDPLARYVTPTTPAREYASPTRNPRRDLGHTTPRPEPPHPVRPGSFWEIHPLSVIMILACGILIMATIMRMPESEFIFTDTFSTMDHLEVIHPNDVRLMVSEIKIKRAECGMVLRREGFSPTDIPQLYDASQPFFCINLPLRNYSRPATPGSMRETTVGSHASLEGETVYLMTQLGKEVWRSFMSEIRETDFASLGSSPTYTKASAALMGYYEQHFFARSFEHDMGLWHATESELTVRSLIVSVAYSQLREVGLALRDLGGRHCVCGPHLGLARNLVLFVEDQQLQFFIEPTLSGRKGPEDYQDMEYYYTENLYGGRVDDNIIREELVIKLHMANMAILQHLGISDTAFLPRESVVVESFDVDFDPATGAISLPGRADIGHYDGACATCLQYCEALSRGFARTSKN